MSATGPGSRANLHSQIFYFAGAPAAIHDASVIRSAPVISVMLPGGMKFERTATTSISGARTAICSSLSSSTPIGAAAMPAQTGSAAWHMLQRDTMMSETCANETCANFGAAGNAPVVASGGPAAESQMMPAIPAAATAHVHHGLLLPAWRELKKWRITGPMASTIATMTQLNRVAKNIG